jgi:hypothetical protein
MVASAGIRNTACLNHAKCTPEIGFVLQARPDFVLAVLSRYDLTREWLAWPTRTTLA